MFSLVSLFFLMLFVGLAIAGVIAAFQGRYRIGIVALAYAGALFGPDFARSIDQNLRDIDLEIHRDDSRVEVRNRGPILFSHRSRPNRYGGRIHRFRTLVETEGRQQEIGFGIWDIGRKNYTDRRTICPSVEGPAGLREMIDAASKGPHNTVHCSVPFSTVRYMTAEGDGPATTIRCTMTGDGTRNPCSMRIFHGRYWLTVAMWDVPPEGWRAVRDHVTAIIDQSFTISEDD